MKQPLLAPLKGENAGTLNKLKTIHSEIVSFLDSDCQEMAHKEKIEKIPLFLRSKVVVYKYLNFKHGILTLRIIPVRCALSGQ